MKTKLLKRLRLEAQQSYRVVYYPIIKKYKVLEYVVNDYWNSESQHNTKENAIYHCKKLEREFILEEVYSKSKKYKPIVIYP